MFEKEINWLNTMGVKNYSFNEYGQVNVKGDVNLNNKGIYNIEVEFGLIEGMFSCDFNHLNNLIGAPNAVCESFSCSNNNLTSLEGSPSLVCWDFICSDNRLKSLEGGPVGVGGNYRCVRNQLTNLEGIPKLIFGEIDYTENIILDLISNPIINSWILNFPFDYLSLGESMEYGFDDRSLKEPLLNQLTKYFSPNNSKFFSEEQLEATNYVDKINPYNNYYKNELEQLSQWVLLAMVVNKHDDNLVFA